MSASEKLKAIDPDPWLYDDGTVNYNEGGMKDFRFVLPKIVEVVGKAQIIATHTYPATYAGERDGMQVYGTPEDLKRFVDEELAPALVALDEALS